jgi:hypothetical protein
VQLVIELLEKRFYLGSTLDVIGSTLLGSSLAFLSWDSLAQAMDGGAAGPRPTGPASSGSWTDPWATDLSQLAVLSVTVAEPSREPDAASTTGSTVRPAPGPEPAFPSWSSDPLGDPLADPLRNDWLMGAAFASGKPRFADAGGLDEFRYGGGGDAGSGTAPGSPGPRDNAEMMSSENAAGGFAGTGSGALPVLPSSLLPPAVNPPTSAGTASSTSSGPDVAALAQSAGHLPLRFQPNMGQTDARVKFLSGGPGYELFLAADEAVLALSKPATAPASTVPGKFQPRPAQATAPSEVDVLRMQWVGANPNTEASGVMPQPGLSNYFIGNDREKWLTDVPTFGQVAYHDLYPGVDLLYYGNQQRELEYDLVVYPGADPGAVQLAIAGAEGVNLDA